MRRLLRELATKGEVKGDVTTLEDFSVIAKLKEQEESVKLKQMRLAHPSRFSKGGNVHPSHRRSK